MSEERSVIDENALEACIHAVLRENHVFGNTVTVCEGMALKEIMNAIRPYLRSPELLDVAEQNELILTLEELPPEGMRIMEPNKYKAIHIKPRAPKPVATGEISFIEEIKPCPYVNGFTADNTGVSFVLQKYDRYSDFILFESGKPNRCFRFSQPEPVSIAPKQNLTKEEIAMIISEFMHLDEDEQGIQGAASRITELAYGN